MDIHIYETKPEIWKAIRAFFSDDLLGDPKDISTPHQTLLDVCSEMHSCNCGGCKWDFDGEKCRKRREIGTSILQSALVLWDDYPDSDAPRFAYDNAVKAYIKATLEETFFVIGEELERKEKRAKGVKTKT